MAVRVGKRAGVALFRGIQGRRKRKGKRQLFPEMGLNGRFIQAGGSQRTTRAAAPVRVTTQITSTVRDERVMDTEPCNVTILGVEDDAHEAASVRLSPLESELAPRLARKAVNFTEYDVTRLKFIYTPIVGTAYAGQIAFGWTPNASVEGTDLNDSASVLSMPKNTAFSAGSPAEFVIPWSDMSQGGKKLMIPGTDSTVGELTRYYAGTFAFIAYDCEDTSKLGTLKLEYGYMLRRPKLDTQPTASRMVVASPAYDAPGEAMMRRVPATGDHFDFSYVSVRPETVFIMSAGTGGVTLTDAASGAVNEIYHFTASGSGNYVQVFDLGRRVGRRHLTVDPAATATTVSLLLVSIPQLAML